MTRTNSAMRQLPADTQQSMAVLDAMTGSRDATVALLNGTARPGLSLFGSVAMQSAAAYPVPASAGPPLPGSDAAARRIAHAGGGALVLGGTIISAQQAMNEVRDSWGFSQVEQALSRFHLDRTKVADVFAARAYVWAVNKAPWHYFWDFHYDLGWSGRSTRASASR